MFVGGAGTRAEREEYQVSVRGTRGAGRRADHTQGTTSVGVPLEASVWSQ